MIFKKDLLNISTGILVISTCNISSLSAQTIWEPPSSDSKEWNIKTIPKDKPNNRNKAIIKSTSPDKDFIIM